MAEIGTGRKRAVVTGAASGMGRAVATKMRESGHEVIGVDRDPIDAAVDSTRQLDLGDRAALDALCAELAAADPPVDVLVNVAGFAEVTTAGDFDPEVFWRTLAVNMFAPTALAAAVGRGMREQRWGRIVNVSSVQAIASAPDSLAYVASKTALTGVTRSIAIEWAKENVLVNAVAPGYVRTAMSVVNGVSELETDEFRSVYVDGGQLPMGRAAEPEEVAEAILWLASPQNTYVTGATLVADGGLTAVM